MSDPVADTAGPVMVRFADEPWRRTADAGTSEGMRGKRLVEGDGGFWLQHVEMVPGHVVAPHSHSHAELFVVLSGSCSFGPQQSTLRTNDTVMVPADHEYGFTVGPEGMTFLIVRNGAARHSSGRNLSTTIDPGGQQQ